jgi:hypothetical protein
MHILLLVLSLLAPRSAHAEENALEQLRQAAGEDSLPGMTPLQLQPAPARQPAIRATNFTRPEPYRQVDLTPQFQKRPSDQGSVGSCHDFAAVALVEAAMRRAGRAGRLDLSEADLFIHDTLLNAAYLDGFVRNGRIESQEGTLLAKDLPYILSHGIATESTLPYAAFLFLYLQAVGPSQRRDIQTAANLTTLWSSIDFGRATWEGAPLDTEQTRRLVAAETANFGTQTLLRNLLRRHFPAADADRERIRAHLQGFSLVPFTGDSSSQYTADRLRRFFPGKYLTASGSYHSYQIPGRDCAQLGLERSLFLRHQLDLGRPVAVSFEVGGLPGWDAAGAAQTASTGVSHASHSIIIQGYTNESGSYLFTTRNSWGSDAADYPIHAEGLCHIFELFSVRAPGEPQ